MTTSDFIVWFKRPSNNSERSHALKYDNRVSLARDLAWCSSVPFATHVFERRSLQDGLSLHHISGCAGAHWVMTNQIVITPHYRDGQILLASQHLTLSQSLHSGQPSTIGSLVGCITALSRVNNVL